jgi:2-amino-4-hydroxy-6-hydroxymethyldihydropteridine diphosphokinase
MEIGLSLGSNLGDRLGHLRSARDRLLQWPGVERVAQSPVYETEPVDVAPRYADRLFLNAVLIIRGDADPEVLNARCREIEAAMGRVRTGDRNAPRPIDIDIIYAGPARAESATLTLPHPRWTARRFVVQPLADVRPDLRLPPGTRTVAEVLSSLPARPEVVLFERVW